MKQHVVIFWATLALCMACQAEKFKGSNANRAETTANEPLIMQVDGKTKETFNGAQPAQYEVDIIFLLDTSDSMDDKIARTMQNLSNLMGNFLNKVKGYNYQLFIVGEKSPPVQGERVGFIKRGVGSHNALSAAQEAILGAIKASNLEVRPSAVKELVVVSDDDSKISANDFLAWMDANPDRAAEVRVNGIVATQGRCSFLRGDQGDVYIDLANNPRTKGSLGNICDNNWDSIFNNLGQQLTQLKTAPKMQVTLSKPVSNPQSITVAINGQLLDASQFTYDATSNMVYILRTTNSSDKIEVMYQ